MQKPYRYGGIEGPRMQEEANVSEDEQHEKVAAYMKTQD